MHVNQGSTAHNIRKLTSIQLHIVCSRNSPYSKLLTSWSSTPSVTKKAPDQCNGKFMISTSISIKTKTLLYFILELVIKRAVWKRNIRMNMPFIFARRAKIL
ncbi:hypothetical protein Drorol1_Dr00005834, partial [Drosera rotundifolia]